MGETAKSCETIPRLAFVGGSGLDKNLSRNVPLLVSSAPALLMDEGARP